MRALVRTAGAESNVVQVVEFDDVIVHDGCMEFYLGGAWLYTVGLSRLIDIRPTEGGTT